MQKTQQAEVRAEVEKFMVRYFRDEDGQEDWEFRTPEYLEPFVDRGMYWWKVKNACGYVDPNSISEIDLQCLLAAQEGIDRANRAQLKEPPEED